MEAEGRGTMPVMDLSIVVLPLTTHLQRAGEAQPWATWSAQLFVVVPNSTLLSTNMLTFVRGRGERLRKPAPLWSKGAEKIDSVRQMERRNRTLSTAR